jgi:hypothetical protein
MAWDAQYLQVLITVVATLVQWGYVIQLKAFGVLG